MYSLIHMTLEFRHTFPCSMCGGCCKVWVFPTLLSENMLETNTNLTSGIIPIKFVSDGGILGEDAG